jgi:hypothetical protein
MFGTANDVLATPCDVQPASYGALHSALLLALNFTEEFAKLSRGPETGGGERVRERSARFRCRILKRQWWMSDGGSPQEV